MAQLWKRERFLKRDDFQDEGTLASVPEERIAEGLWMVDWKAEGLPYCGVYVITTDALYPCKIGMSINAVKRVATFQCSHWRELQVSGYRYCETVAQASKVERECHKILKDNGQALLGEWFDLRPQKALEVMEWAALTLGITLRSDIPNQKIRDKLEGIANHIRNNRMTAEINGRF